MQSGHDGAHGNCQNLSGLLVAEVAEIDQHEHIAEVMGKICERYDGNNTGAEPSSVGVGADGTFCIYAAADISFH